MPYTAGILMIVTGFAIMAFGLFLFYAWLPLLYGLIGLEIGLLVGKSLTGTVGAIAITLGIIGAVLFGAAAYFLEPYRRIMLGVFGGILVGLSLAVLLGIERLFGGAFATILALLCGLIGGFVLPRYFDLLVIAASSIGGAVMVITGANLILPDVELFDRARGGLLPILLTLVLAAIGLGWQFSNIEKWVHPSAGNHGGMLPR
jgi:hypothetical protein